jgi:hypothetical protein
MRAAQSCRSTVAIMGLFVLLAKPAMSCYTYHIHGIVARVNTACLESTRMIHHILSLTDVDAIDIYSLRRKSSVNEVRAFRGSHTLNLQMGRLEEGLGEVQVGPTRPCTFHLMPQD